LLPFCQQTSLDTSHLLFLNLNSSRFAATLYDAALVSI
jgi:hypothetical protein